MPKGPDDRSSISLNDINPALVYPKGVAVDGISEIKYSNRKRPSNRWRIHSKSSPAPIIAVVYSDAVMLSLFKMEGKLPPKHGLSWAMPACFESILSAAADRHGGFSHKAGHSERRSCNLHRSYGLFDMTQYFPRYAWKQLTRIDNATIHSVQSAADNWKRAGPSSASDRAARAFRRWAFLQGVRGLDRQTSEHPTRNARAFLHRRARNGSHSR